MSAKAISRILGIKVGNPARKVILYGLADSAHSDGTHAQALVEDLTRFAECSPATARRHLRGMIADGFIRPAPSGVEHQYEIAMTDETRLRWKAGEPT
jgi:hypothetical protein